MHISSSKMHFCRVTVLLIAFVAISGSQAQSELVNVTRNVRQTDLKEPLEVGLWSQLLEEWTITNKNMPARGRTARIIQTVPAPQFRASAPLPTHSKYIPASESYLTRRTDDGPEFQSQPNLNNLRVLPNNAPPTFQQPQNYFFANKAQKQLSSPREVSETDLYLLGAIEKMVFRVDYMEKRLKRTEQLVYYLMAGNNQKPEVEPCPKNFTKIGNDCFFIESSEKVDWKTAADRCRAQRSSLAEFDTVAKFRDVAGFVLNNKAHRGHDFWIGGLNPGLLWIWASSAKPVNNANFDSYANKTEAINKVSPKATHDKNEKDDKTLTSGFPEIHGDGRCLRLSYNPTLFNYGYTGHDCSARQSFMCVILDKTLDNEISRLAKELEFDIV